jgi:hypothetical protein
LAIFGRVPGALTANLTHYAGRFRMPRAVAMLLSSLILVAAVIAVAQEPIRVTTRLIEVNVVARDHLGAVGDLEQRDFKVFDNGKEQPIAIFRVSRTAPPNAAQTPLPTGVF